MSVMIPVNMRTPGHEKPDTAAHHAPQSVRQKPISNCTPDVLQRLGTTTAIVQRTPVNASEAQSLRLTRPHVSFADRAVGPPDLEILAERR
jgi:hypothetical protein